MAARGASEGDPVGGQIDCDDSAVGDRPQLPAAPTDAFCTALASQQLQFDFTSDAGGEVVPLHNLGVAGASDRPRNLQSHAAATAGEIVILPRDRLAWHKQLVEDCVLSANAVRVAIALGSYFNNRTGRTFVGLKKLARELGLSLGTVRTATRQLASRGHLKVAIGGGRGWATEYSMVLKRVQPAAPFSGTERVQSINGKGAAACTPTLTSPSEKNSARADARDSALGFPGERLRKRLGHDVFVAWFSAAKVEGCSEGIVTLSVGTAFLKSRIERDYREALLECWTATDPCTKAVEVVVRRAERRR